MKSDNICVDVDDVLFDFQGPLMRYHNKTYGTSFKPEDYTTYRFSVFWRCTGEEAARRVNEFQHSDYFRNLLPVEGAVESVSTLIQRGKTLFPTTARPDWLKAITEEQLNNYFRGKFPDIIFASNHYTKRENCGMSKGEICKKLNASLVDDSLDYILQCASLGLGGILFGNYPWNQNGTLSQGIIRCPTWREVLEEIE